MALVWPDAIKGYGDKYGDTSLSFCSSSDLFLPFYSIVGFSDFPVSTNELFWSRNFALFGFSRSMQNLHCATFRIIHFTIKIGIICFPFESRDG